MMPVEGMSPISTKMPSTGSVCSVPSFVYDSPCTSFSPNTEVVCALVMPSYLDGRVLFQQ